MDNLETESAARRAWSIGSQLRWMATLPSSVVLVLLIGIGLVVVPRVSQAASAAIGLDPLASQMLLSLLFAAIMILTHHWLRVDDADVEQQAHAMHDALRRYVPGALAAQLESGHDVESGEREISVLFADIRGFTAFSESRQATEIFSTVNQHTERVSRIVRRYGGNVVAFSGDGIMALFGAPRPLPGKERAAVEAGRAIITAMRSDHTAAGPPLSVGVGIATGTDCVGNIGAADRVIWSAIGNTTNLAARLQSLTRSLNAAIIIDQPTWAAGRLATAGFEPRGNVRVRGRRNALDVYVLPLPDGGVLGNGGLSQKLVD